MGAGQEVCVRCSYAVEGGEVGFELADDGGVAGGFGVPAAGAGVDV
jgi:hypothetical protein